MAPETRGGWRGRCAQHGVALLANLTTVCTGVAMAWTSPALPVLQGTSNFNETISQNLTAEEGSWVSALVPLGAAIGALPAGVLADKFGRKSTLLSLSIPYLGGFLLMIFKDVTVWLIYVGRFITGLGAGATTVLVPLYCEEIAEIEIRGALGAYLDFMMCAGILWIYIFGALLPYEWFTASACILPIIFFITFIWVPESPVFLARKGHTDEAKKSLELLRGGNRDYDVQKEIQNILSSLHDDPNITKKSFLACCSKNLFQSTTARALGIVLGLMLFQQLSGINAVIFYTEQIFNEAGSNLSADMSTIIVGVVQMVAVFFSSLTVDHLGRRFLLILSTVVMAICLLALSLNAHFSTKIDEGSLYILRWIPLITVILYTVVYALGFGPLPWFMMAELLPDHAKGWGGAIAVSLNWTVALILTKEFPILLGMSQAVTYGVLCIFCVMGSIFIFLYVPETKGKTKTEIQEVIGGKLR